ncbi:hypothetical protein Tco_1236231 [Tanacetum coccineum]
MFDEYFNPPTIAVSPVQEAAAPRAEVLASINQDAPSTKPKQIQTSNEDPSGIVCKCKDGNLMNLKDLKFRNWCRAKPSEKATNMRCEKDLFDSLTEHINISSYGNRRIPIMSLSLCRMPKRGWGVRTTRRKYIRSAQFLW